MRLSLDSLAFRLAAAFLAGAVLFQVLLTVVVFWPGDPGRPVFLLPSPDQAEAMAAALEAAPPTLRPAILKALNSDVTTVRLEPGPLVDGPAPAVRQAPRLERMFARYAEGLGGRPFSVQVRSNARIVGSPERGVGAAGPVRLVVGLRTDETMTIERNRPPAVRRFLDRAVLVGAIGAATLGLVLLVCLRQTARPITSLADAARAFARDLSTPDLPTTGAREIKALSTAFNDMKRTIRALIDDRTRVLAAIAHDMRTYLTRLRLRAEFMDDPTQRERMLADLNEMGQLLDDTLTFAREVSPSGAPKPRSTDVRAEVEALVAVRRELGEPVRLVAGDDQPLMAACATLALRRMVANLVDNAVRYGGGATLSTRREGDEIVVTVEDEGPGVPEDALARLTRPFERLETSRGRQTGGAGLGLAIVQALADSQGGRFVLENRPGGGVRAALRLIASN